jgi:hypothetical protein
MGRRFSLVLAAPAAAILGAALGALFGILAGHLDDYYHSCYDPSYDPTFYTAAISCGFAVGMGFGFAGGIGGAFEGKKLNLKLREETLARLRKFGRRKDPVGCRQTAEMWEKLNRADADSLYNAACMRAVTAAVLRAADYPRARHAYLPLTPKMLL